METADRYRWFGEVEARGSSPSYRVLANGVADDPELCGWLDQLPPSRRQPNLLLACVRLLGGPTSSWGEFRAFLADHLDEVWGQMSTRSTQTNEVARCASFLPVLAQLPQPISLIEVGASAGLCLYPDRYSYAFGRRRVGDSALEISVRCEGEVPVPEAVPRVVWRRGVDLNPLSALSPDDVAWLHACIWPEHEERRRRLDLAVSIVAADPPQIIAGDLLDEIEPVLDEVPADTTSVVFHSAVLAYLDGAARREFARKMQHRDGVVWLSNEAPGVVPGVAAPMPNPDRAHFVLGRDGESAVAFTDPHGAWLAWLADG